MDDLSRALSAIAVLPFLGCSSSGAPPHLPPPSKEDFIIERSCLEQPLDPDAIGSDCPIYAAVASPDGRWTVLSEGWESWSAGHASAYAHVKLVEGRGRGRSIEDFITSDSTGRYIVLREDGRLIVHDTIGGGREDLSAWGADMRASKRVANASVDSEGNVLYFRPHHDGTIAVLHRFGTPGAGTEIERDREHLRRGEIDQGWVVLHTVAPEIDYLSEAGTRAFASDRPLFQRSAKVPRKAPHSLTDVNGTIARDVGELLAVWRGKLVISGLNGDVLLERRPDAPEGGPAIRELLPPGCAGKLVIPPGPEGELGIACMRGDSQVVPVYAWVGNIKLTATLPRRAVDHLAILANRIALQTYDPREELQDPSVVNLGGMRILASTGYRALMEKAHAVSLMDFSTGDARFLGFTTDGILRRGSFVALGGALIDLGQPDWVWKYPGYALAVAADGRVLMSANDDDGKTSWACGPLHYMTPYPPERVSGALIPEQSQ